MKAAVILAMVALATSAPAFHLSTPPLVTPSERGSTHAQSQVPATTSPKPEVNTFEERWWPGDGSFAQQPLSFEERWAPVAQAWGRRVQTIRILPDAPAPSREAVAAINTAVPLPEPRPVIRQAKPRPNRVADICTRHGMHKQVTNNGRSWRCRK